MRYLAILLATILIIGFAGVGKGENVNVKSMDKIYAFIDDDWGIMKLQRAPNREKDKFLEFEFVYFAMKNSRSFMSSWPDRFGINSFEHVIAKMEREKNVIVYEFNTEKEFYQWALENCE